MNRNIWTGLAFAGIAAALLPGAHAQQAPAPAAAPPGTFPFVIPWNDAAKTITDVSALNPAPLTDAHRVVVKDGHFFDGTGRRVRFVGTNFTFAANFPNKEDAEGVAARLHKLGFNCIRLHHMDMHKSPRGIWDAKEPGKQKLDAEQLDRLDYLISMFKKYGIYVDVNLHVSRGLMKEDGFTETEGVELHGKVVSYFEPRFIQMQKNYARDLLTHVNPYTKMSYTDDPTVAVVEITNEDTLLGQAWGNGIETLPATYKNQLRTLWNEWLLRKYSSTEGMKRGWGGGKPLGENIIKNGSFKEGTAGWTLEHQTTSNAELTTEDADGGKALHIAVQALGVEPWHLQLHQGGMEFTPGANYTLTFRAKSNVTRTFNTYTGMTKPPWRHTGLDKTLTLTPQWRKYSVVFSATQPEQGANRLSFGLGAAMGDIWLTDVQIRPGILVEMEPGESLEAKNVSLTNPSATAQGKDYIQFLMDTEIAYAKDMKDYVQKTLKSKSQVTCSQSSYAGIGGLRREAEMDWIDMHSYWQHPRFPNKPWDSKDWNIPNTAMVRDASGGTLSRLAMYRVAGMPFTVSEYNHPAPNDFQAESMPMVFAYAAWQDWDGVFLFDYNSDRDNWGSDKIKGFFGSDTNAAKMAMMPASAALFLRGDLAPSTAGTITLQIPRSQTVDLLARYTQAERLWDAQKVTKEDLIRFESGVEWTNGAEVKVVRRQKTYVRKPDSDLAWMPGKETALFKVESPRSLQIIGFPGTTPATVSRLSANLHPTERGFLALTLTATDDKPVAESKSLLLTAVGEVTNVGIVWNETRTSVTNQWGKGPALAQGIPATITLQGVPAGLIVYALDATGARTGTVPSRVQDGNLSFEIGPQHKTLWYEISAYPTPVRTGTAAAR